MIAVDVNSEKESWARKFGATDFINPLKNLPEGKRIQDHLVEITDGGLDYTFDATGNVSRLGKRERNLNGKHYAVTGRRHACCSRGVPQRMGRLDYHRCCRCRERDFHATVSFACWLTCR